MKSKVLIIVCLVIVTAFLLAVKNGYFSCSNISNFESITPNACIDMMELGFDSTTTDACVAYSTRCDSKDDVYHSPVVAAEVQNLYQTIGKDATKGAQFVAAFGKDPCVNPITCSSNADCPGFLRCPPGGGACQ